MRAPSRSQKTTRQRMAHATPVAPKAKLGKPSFFNTLGKSILTTFSPKSAERRQPAVDDDCYSDDDYYEDENDYLVEPKPLPGNFSFEEARAAFFSKGKGSHSPSNPIRNLIGETSSQRQDDRAHAVSKSLPRTPVTHTRLYPELNADVEDVELRTEEAPEQSGPGLTVRKNRNIRVKGQPPTRVSERNRNKAFQPLVPETINPVESTLINDIYLKLESDPESADENDDFSSVKSHNDLEVEQDLERTRERVEEDLRGKEKVETPADDQSLPPLKYSSTPISRYQNFYTDQSQQTTEKLAPTNQVGTQTISPSTRLVGTQTTLPPFEKPQPSSSKQIETKFTPYKSVNFKLTPSQQTIDTNPPRPTMAHPNPYETLYKCLRETGASREEAAAGAKAALALTKTACGASEFRAVDIVEKEANCSTATNQSYYNSQKLLQNQQQQTIALLAQVPAFNGMGSTKFEDWIQHFERVVDTADFEEGRKIKLLGSKLFGSAGDCITTFQLNYPREAKSFVKVKQNLHERFHGGDNRKMYFTEFKNCIRNSGESIRDYACRLQKLYSFAYPTEVGKTIDADVLKLRETMLMDGFLGGLKSNLRERMSFKDYRNLNDLVKATEKCAAILNEAKLEKRSVEFVNAVSANANAQELRETKNELSELKSVIEQLSQKMRATQLTDKSHESINAVATGHNAQLAESKQEIEELKNLLKAIQRLRENDEKSAAPGRRYEPSDPQAQPMRQYQQNHSGLVTDNSTRAPHQPPVHRNPPPFYKDNHNNPVNGPPHRGERYCTYCANNGRNPTTHNTDKCGWGPNGPTCFKCHQGGHIARDCPSAALRSDARYASPAQNPGKLNPWNQEN
ncbi:hypothetical protein OUZ56_018265 [Daphnia magna]|uniref:CCHC-type domain-containing protein n=1 Tax=Daphnia magna TaxID=35525 RepID=A0ABQ9Z8F5_9CRUS|nr:hypothetical protein OUZ56_018265 [Daphnia magna]